LNRKKEPGKISRVRKFESSPRMRARRKRAIGLARTLSSRLEAAFPEFLFPIKSV